MIENVIASAPARTSPFFYRSAVGAEIDLLLDIPGQGLWAIDIKRGLSSLPEQGFSVACQDVRPSKRFVVNGGSEQRLVSEDLELVSVTGLMTRLLRLH